MNYQILDLYSDYLLSSFGQTTATGLSKLMDGDISHDQVTRMLSSPKMTSKAWWKMVKPKVRQIQQEDGVMIIDDSIMEKPYTDENEIICWHYDHAKGKTVKGINFLTTLYYAQDIALPVAFELVSKTETYLDKKTGKEKRKSKKTKNERYRQMLQTACQNQIPFCYVLNDLWFASAENMRFVKMDIEKEFIMALKSNRKVALSSEDKAQGVYQRIDQLDIPEDTPLVIHLEGVPFPLQLIRQVFTNEDGSTGILYLVTSDLSLTYDGITTIYGKRWNVEPYHKSLKQNASLSKSPTKIVRTQSNHVFASLCAYIKLEMLKVATNTNHFALKAKLYTNALQSAFQTLDTLQPIRLAA